jgi:hypothetical protein
MALAWLSLALSYPLKQHMQVQYAGLAPELAVYLTNMDIMQ